MKRIIVSGIKLPVSHCREDVFEKAEKLLKRCGIPVGQMTIYKQSLDARRKKEIHFEYSVSAELLSEKTVPMEQNIRVVEDESGFDAQTLRKNKCEKKNICIVGSGPCGLFAAYIFALCGVNVTVLERGCDVDRRTGKIDTFWKTGVLDTETNIQFGEGGAGTFSDGKLNTRIGDSLQKFVLETFVKFGAPQEILYQAKPHIGTDYLKVCVKNMRKEIQALGGSVLFETKLTDVIVKNGEVVAVEINNSSVIECDALILAIGHSSRDTYEMLFGHGVAMEQKPFAAGVRIEHSREFVNRMQYGDFVDIDLLPTADYRLAYNGPERSCYSFCMCPGGVVVNASSEPERLVVNGMSYHDRMADNSNSALIVTVRPEDFGGVSPLAGIEFQRKYESLAYKTGGGKGPVQLVKDFVRNKVSSGFDGVRPSFTGNTEFVDLRECLPGFISETLKEGFLDFDRKVKGFSGEGAIMTGVEMRTSAPLRIKRNENYESVSHKGLYPAGEGAGYAGGIMSAAIDGIKVAKRILES